MHSTYEINYVQSLLSSVWPDWHITRRLGKGSYGKVYEILRNDLGANYVCALKVLQMEADDPEDATAALIHVSEPGMERDGGQKAMAYGASGTAAYPTSHIPFIGPQEDALEEFVRDVSAEIDAMMRLKGAPNVVSIEDYTVLRRKGARTIFIRMEKLETLEEHIGARGGLDRAGALRAGMDICRALALCEQENILHRDIKPSNIFYSEKAGYKLGDFGISRTMDSIFEKKSMSGIGTIQFMAPEVYRGEKYNNTVDLYALGVTLYTMFNDGYPPLYLREGADSTEPAIPGSHPANRPGAMSGAFADPEAGAPGSHYIRILHPPCLTTPGLHEANMRRMNGAPIPAPSRADPGLAEALCKACDPDPERRFQTASAFRAALRACLHGEEPASGDVPGGWGIPALPTALFAAAIILFLAAGGIFLRKGKKADAAPVPYTVLCLDEKGNVLEETQREGQAGEEIQVDSPLLDGYEAQDKTQTLLLSADGTDKVATFHYIGVGGEKDAPAASNSADEEGTGLETSGTEASEDGYLESEISESEETESKETESKETESKETGSEETESKETTESDAAYDASAIDFNTAGSVRILNKKYAQSEDFAYLARRFEKISGIRVSVESPKASQYTKVLQERITGSGADPTLFMLSGPQEFKKYGYECLDLTDSAAARQLEDEALSLKGEEGNIYGLASIIESFGLSVNTRLLKEAGYSLSDIESFDDLRHIALDISARKDRLGFSAFTAPSINTDDGYYRIAQHAPTVPLYYELRDNAFEVDKKLQGAYMDSFRDYVDLWLDNSTVSRENAESRSLADARQEFMDGKAVFHQDGSWHAKSLEEALGDKLAVIPLYMGMPGERHQALNETCSYYWCVNRYAADDDVEATLQFLEWLVSSEEALQIMADDMDFQLPYRKAPAPDNIYLRTLASQKAAGDYPVLQYYAYGKEESWVNALNRTLRSYAAGTGSWEAVREAFTTLW